MMDGSEFRGFGVECDGRVVVWSLSGRCVVLCHAELVRMLSELELTICVSAPQDVKEREWESERLDSCNFRDLIYA